MVMEPKYLAEEVIIHPNHLHWFIAIFHVCFLGGHSATKTIKSSFFHGSYIYIWDVPNLKKNRELAPTTSNHLNETQTRHRVVTKSESPESTAQATAPRPSCGQGKLHSEPMLINFFGGDMFVFKMGYIYICKYIHTYGTRNRRIPSVAQKTRCLWGKPPLGFHHVPLLAPCCHFGFFVTMIRKKNAWALRLEKGLEGWIGKLWDPKATPWASIIDSNQ